MDTNKHASKHLNTPSVHTWISPSTSPSPLHPPSLCQDFICSSSMTCDLFYSICFIYVTSCSFMLMQDPNHVKSQISNKEQQSPRDFSDQRSSSSVWEAAYPPFWFQLRAEECVEERECVAGRWVMASGAGTSAGGLRWTWSWVRSPP